VSLFKASFLADQAIACNTHLPVAVLLMAQIAIADVVVAA
jgi:hypothetical protein